MKRFIEVSKRVGGRTITQRYPARSVGSTEINDRVHNSQADDNVCPCGFWVCSDTGPCAPKPASTPPLADVLPEGWKDGATGLFHASGAVVWHHGTGLWYWAPDDERGCWDPKRTQAEAMAAAVASAQSEEPYGCVRRQGMSPRECVESGHYWCHFNKLTTEPALRPGWATKGKTHDWPEYWLGEFSVYRRSAQGTRPELPWRVLGDSNHATLHEAMERAEALARGES